MRIGSTEVQNRIPTISSTGTSSLTAYCCLSKTTRSDLTHLVNLNSLFPFRLWKVRSSQKLCVGCLFPNRITAMSILIAEDNMAQRHYLREILEKEFPSHVPVFEAADGEETVKLALGEQPAVCILDIQVAKLSGVKAARAIWREFPTARIIFWTQFPHEIYINEIRKIVKSVDPPPAYGFIHKNNPESRFLRFVAAVLEDGADMI